MNSNVNFNLRLDAVMYPYTQDVVDYCEPFTCGDSDLDDFFASDALFYDSEMLGKTYAWIDASNNEKIMALVTLANDSVKSRNLAKSARNRIQRGLPNAKRGLNLPAILIGRLGVSTQYHGKGMNIGTQILNFIKDWFRSKDNKTGCRFIVVDAYNNERTLHFYEKNGFKPLYKTEAEERAFLEIEDDSPLATRFMFYDLKSK